MADTQVPTFPGAQPKANGGGTFKHNVPSSIPEFPGAKIKTSSSDQAPVPQSDDYDYAAATKAGVKPDSNGHLPDTFKLPNHITFSDESQYSTPEKQGGKWFKDENQKWHFRPSDFNLTQHSSGDLQDYFKNNEPDAVLDLPQTDTFFGAAKNAQDNLTATLSQNKDKIYQTQQQPADLLKPNQPTTLADIENRMNFPQTHEDNLKATSGIDASDDVAEMKRNSGWMNSDPNNDWGLGHYTKDIQDQFNTPTSIKLAQKFTPATPDAPLQIKNYADNLDKMNQDEFQSWYQEQKNNIEEDPKYKLRGGLFEASMSKPEYDEYMNSVLGPKKEALNDLQQDFEKMYATKVASAITKPITADNVADIARQDGLKIIKATGSDADYNYLSDELAKGDIFGKKYPEAHKVGLGAGLNQYDKFALYQRGLILNSQAIQEKLKVLVPQVNDIAQTYKDQLDAENTAVSNAAASGNKGVYDAAVANFEATRAKMMAEPLLKQYKDLTDNLNVIAQYGKDMINLPEFSGVKSANDKQESANNDPWWWKYSGQLMFHGLLDVGKTLVKGASIAAIPFSSGNSYRNMMTSFDRSVDYPLADDIKGTPVAQMVGFASFLGSVAIGSAPLKAIGMGSKTSGIVSMIGATLPDDYLEGLKNGLSKIDAIHYATLASTATALAYGVTPAAAFLEKPLIQEGRINLYKAIMAGAGGDIKKKSWDVLQNYLKGSVAFTEGTVASQIASNAINGMYNEAAGSTLPTENPFTIKSLTATIAASFVGGAPVTLFHGYQGMKAIHKESMYLSGLEPERVDAIAEQMLSAGKWSQTKADYVKGVAHDMSDAIQKLHDMSPTTFNDLTYEQRVKAATALYVESKAADTATKMKGGKAEAELKKVSTDAGQAAWDIITEKPEEKKEEPKVEPVAAPKSNTEKIKSVSDLLNSKDEVKPEEVEVKHKRPDANTMITQEPLQLYRGTGGTTRKNFTYVNGEYYATSQKHAEKFGTVDAFKLAKGSKVFDFDSIKSGKSPIPHDISLDPEQTREWLVDRGYDATRNTNADGVEYVSLNPEKIKSDSKTPVYRIHEQPAYNQKNERTGSWYSIRDQHGKMETMYKRDRGDMMIDEPYTSDKAMAEKRLEEIQGQQKSTVVTKKPKAKSTAYVLKGEPQSAHDAVLQYFHNGGKITPDDFMHITGWGKIIDRGAHNSAAKGITESRKRVWMIGKDAQPLDRIAEALMGEPETQHLFQGMDTQDVINIIQDVVTSHDNKSSLRQSFSKNQPKEDEDYYEGMQRAGFGNYGDLTDEEAEALVNNQSTEDFIEHAASTIDDMEISDIDASKILRRLLKEYADEKGEIDIDKLTDDIESGDIHKKDIIFTHAKILDKLNSIIDHEHKGLEENETSGRTEKSNEDSGGQVDREKSDARKLAEEKVTSAESKLQAAKDKYKAKKNEFGKNLKGNQGDLLSGDVDANKEKTLLDLGTADEQSATEALKKYKFDIENAEGVVNQAKTELDNLISSEKNQKENSDLFEQPEEKTKREKLNDDFAKAANDFKDLLDEFTSPKGEDENGPTRSGGGPTDEDVVRSAKLLTAGLKLVRLGVEKGLYKFADIVAEAAKVVGDKIHDLLPYLKKAYSAYTTEAPDEHIDKLDDIKTIRNFKSENLKKDESIPAKDLESDRTGSATSNELGKESIQPNGKGNRVKSESAGEGTGSAEGSKQSDSGVPDDLSAVPGKQGNSDVVGNGEPGYGADVSGLVERNGGKLPDGQRVQLDPKSAASIRRVAKGVEKPVDERVKEQKNVSVGDVKIGDIDNIKSMLPYLYPSQHEDVLKAEQRFFVGAGHSNETGKGILFTNQTGTGKTFVGLGIAKRFEASGKKDILIITPTDIKCKDWIEDGAKIGLNVTQLDSVKDPGKNVVTTTYANMRNNESLHNKEWDLVIYDESHKLNSNEEGSRTTGEEAHKKITLSHYNALNRANEHLDYDAKSSKLYREYHGEGTPYEPSDERKAEYKEKSDSLKKQRDEKAKQLKERTKVVFLSATPIAYIKNLSYGDEYLYTINPPGDSSGSRYNSGNAADNFYMTNFGYRMRYNKLTKPERGVDINLMEQNFADGLIKSGAMSSRKADFPNDYSRQFVLVGDNVGLQIDEGLKMIAADPDMEPIKDIVRKKFNYLYENRLLEAIKAKQAIGRIQKHLSLGRKIVVFHNYNAGVPSHPFDFSDPMLRGGEPESKKQEIRAALDLFRTKYSNLTSLDLKGLVNPIETLTKAFPDNSVIVNGTISKGNRKKNIDAFNKDGSGKDIIIVQRDAGKEGISMHDVSGKHQRVLLDLGLPTKPTDAIQTEGRIYRDGQKSDAVIEYPVLHYSFEKNAYANKIKERVKTPENIALGTQARNLQIAFSEGYQNPTDEHPNVEQGKGGKTTDYTLNTIDEFDKAKTYYFSRQKKTSKTKSYEGDDYYATPEPLGFKMVQWADARPNDNGLEPSAGHGAISRFFPGYSNNTFLEPSYSLASEVGINSTGEIKNQKFEDYHIVNKADFIVTNPPYGHAGATALDHLKKDTVHLHEGGRIVAIVPVGAFDGKFEKWFYNEAGEKQKVPSKDLHLTAKILLPSVTFERAGTSVNTQILIIDKLPKGMEGHQIKEYDLRDVKDIQGLFDRIQNIDMPERVGEIEHKDYFDGDEPSGQEEVTPGAKKETVSATASGANPFAIVKSKHTKTGKDLWVAKTDVRFDRNLYFSLASIAKDNDGYYSSYKGGGAIPGFTFKSESDANRFLNDSNKHFSDSALSEPNEDFKSKISTLTDHINDALEKGKIEEGGLQAFGIIPKIWNAAIDVAKGIVKGGGKLVDAVKAAIDYLKDKAGKFDVTAAAAKLKSLTGKMDVLDGLRHEIVESVRKDISKVKEEDLDQNKIDDLIDMKMSRVENHPDYQQLLADNGITHDEMKDAVKTGLHDLYDQHFADTGKRDQAKVDLKAAIDELKSNEPSVLNKLADTGAAKAAKDIALGMNPFLAKGKSRQVASILTKEKGKEHFNLTKINEQYNKMLNFWNRQKSADNLLFILSMENPDQHGITNPAMKEIAEAYRSRLDDVFKTISSVSDIPYYDDYFPHFWQDPAKAKKFFGAQAKSPMEGSKSFLKKRFYGDILKGMESGLQLASDNPEELVRTAEANAWKFKTANNIFNEYKKVGLIKFVRSANLAPEGWKLVDDPLFIRPTYIPPDVGSDIAKLVQAGGGWYMPEEGARIVKMYLSRGIFGKQGAVAETAKSVRFINNLYNLWELGVGAFHVTTTSLDATFTGMAIGLNDVMLARTGSQAGKSFLGLAKAVTILPHLFEVISKGAKANKRFNDGDIANADVQSMIAGNRRSGADAMYTVNSYYHFRKAWSKVFYGKEYSAIPKGLMASIGVIPEIISKPLMNWYVPALKTGTYLRLIESEINRLKPTTQAEIDVIKQKAGAMIDDRLGQMVYDNIFWNKTAKDLGFLTIRSLGWSGGTVRAVGGAVADVPESVKSLISGQGISPRLAWMTSMVVGTALYGAMYQYLMTGKGPDTIKDFFFPKDGSKNSDGTDNRITLPTYMKDMFAYSKDPIGTIKNKLSPAISMTAEVINNRDFYNEEIMHPDDPFFQKGLSLLKYLGKQGIPFSFRQRPGEDLSFSEQFTTGKGLERKFGLMPANKIFEREPWQNDILAASHVSSHAEDRPKTEYDAEASTAKQEIRDLVFNGQPYEDALNKAISKGYISAANKNNFVKESKLDSYTRIFKGLDPIQQLELLSKHPEKMDDLLPVLHSKSAFDQLLLQQPELLHDHPEYQKIIDKAVNHARVAAPKSNAPKMDHTISHKIKN